MAAAAARGGEDLLAALGPGQAGLRQNAGVLPGPDRGEHVGGDVARVVARHEVGAA